MVQIARQNCRSFTGRFWNEGVKHCFALLPMMLLTLLLLPTRMVAETTTEDPRCALFKGLEGISDVTFTDNGEYPWQMLDLKAEGMTAVSSYFTAESKGLMSSNYYNVDESTSVTEIKFKVSKPILLTSQVLVSSEEEGLLFINVDNKLNLSISGEKQTEYKVLLSAGEHSLELNYYHNGYSGSEYANRAFLYNLKTSTTIDDNVADYESSNNTLTFKKIKSDNLEDLDLSRIAMVNNEQTVSDMCTLLGIDNSAIKSVVFDKSFKTYAPTSLISFFADLNSLQTITDLEYLNTANVTNMSYMFESCSGLTSLDLTNFNTANVTDMDRMFFKCSALTTIYASDKFVTTKVKHGCDMFYECRNLKGYSDSKTDHTFANCGTTGYFTPVFDYAEFDNATGMLTFRRSLSKPAGAYDLNEGNNKPGWLTQKENIYKVVFDASFANARPTSCYYWFCGCSKLTDIEGIENLNTENVTNMNSMFDRCSALTSLDLTNFNTAKVSDMSYMFMGCSALTTIFVSDKFVTDRVTDGRDMFHMCINLIGAIEYDGSKSDHTYANYDNGYFSPEGGFHAYAEFNNATGTLTFSRGLSKPAGAYDLNVGNNTPEWSTQKEDINKVVFDASFANARPTSCYKWFDMCTSLTEIEGIENLNTEKVTNMGSMFSGCHVLNPLDVSNFDTQNVEDMSCMFSNCEGLNSLDLSKFDTQKVTNMNSMFWNSSALTTKYVSDKFVTTKVSSGSEMFKDCTSLKGAIDKYEDSKTDKTYANYKTGYFTKLVGKNGEEMIGAAGETLAAENLILEDGKDFVAYEPFAAKDASYCRDIPKGSTWGTLCLPFEVSLANQNFRAFKLLSADDATETVELEEIETSIAAGTPVIIKMKDGANSLSISEADKAIAKDVQASETANGNYQLQGIYTQKVFDKDADNNCYIVKGNKLMNPAKLLENSSTTQVGSKPFRAYMVDNTTAPAAGAKMFSIAIGGGTTAIDSLNTIADDKAVYYDLQGNRLNAPQKGINIVKRGGKTMKVIIK